MLQALGGGLISKDMAMRELPFTVNVTQELEKIEIENMRSSLLSGITAMAQAIPTMATQGGDPASIVTKIAGVITARQKGQSLEEAIANVFAPQQPVPSAGAATSPVEQPSPVPGATPAGGPPMGGADMAAPTPPPDLQTILSTLSGSGKASGRVTTRG
jgi:hypothetical protein